MLTQAAAAVRLRRRAAAWPSSPLSDRSMRPRNGTAAAVGAYDGMGRLRGESLLLRAPAVFPAPAAESNKVRWPKTPPLPS